jgi:hypothetical protein
MHGEVRKVEILGKFGFLELSEQELLFVDFHCQELMMRMLVEELALMSYLEIKDSKVCITKKGEEKLRVFIQGLPTEDREALK